MANLVADGLASQAKPDQNRPKMGRFWPGTPFGDTVLAIFEGQNGRFWSFWPF